MSKDPQSQFGLRHSMSATNIVKRKVAKTVGKVQPEEKECTSPKLSKLQPINLPSVNLSDDSEPEECAQPPPEDDTAYVLDWYSTTLNQDTEGVDELVIWTRNHVVQLNKAKVNNCSVLICLLMHQLIIPLTKYKEAYNLYKTTSATMTAPLKDIVFKTLSLWGRTLANRRTGISYLMDLCDCEDLRKQLSMIVFPAKICRALNNWLTTFSESSMELPDPENLPTGLSASQPSMLPDPEVLESHTSTSYMPAVGTNHTAGVSEYETCPNRLVGGGGPANLTKYKIKTSKQLSTISFNQAEYRCTLRI